MSLSQFQDIPLDNGRANTEQPNQPIIAVLNYVEKWIPSFINESKAEQIENERGLTQRFVSILLVNLNDIYPFTFVSEWMEDETKGNSAAVDIGILTRDNSISLRNRCFFVLEAKKLGDTDQIRNKEYLVGHNIKKNGIQKYLACGGIERFKKSIHGNELDQCGMIGYMFDKSFDVWYKQINNWIEQLTFTNTDSTIIWSQEDKLSFQSQTHLKANYTSKNKRTKSGSEIDPVMIYHIWVNLQ
jgi:hypothetical protein